MTHFAAFAATDPDLCDLVLMSAGPGAKSQHRPGVTVVTVGSGGEAVCVNSCSNTGETVIIRGDPLTAGCRLTFSGNGRKRLAVEADAFGQHPLYTGCSADGIVLVASDPRLLRAVTPARVNAAALKGYLCLSYVPEPMTLWEGIRSVPPARPHWTSSETVAEDKALDSMEALLRAAVERRVTTEEVGVYLSGGLDSSLIAALLVEAGVRPRLYTLDFGPPYNEEVAMAKSVAAHLALPITVVPARPAQVLRAVTPAARAMGQPFGDSVTVPLYLLGQTARDDVAEVWNGEGGDQLFGGWANKPMIAALTHSGETSEPAELQEYRETFHRFWGLTDHLLTPALRTATAAVDPFVWIQPALNRAEHPLLLHRLRAANLRLKGAQNIAPRMTALAECHGLRVRAPFFDLALTEASFRLSPEKLLAGSCEKFLLKRFAERYLPRQIIWREKRGMGVPSTEWCLGQSRLGWAVRHRLSARRLRARGWFDPEFIRGLLRGEDPTAEGSFRRRRVGEKLWQLYMLEIWSDVHNAMEIGDVSAALL